MVSNTSVRELSLGILTLVILYTYPRRLKKLVPPQLVALVVGTLVSLTVFHGQAIRTIATIGEITPGLPEFQVPTFSMGSLQLMFVNAIVLATVGSIDCLLTCLVSDSLTRTEHKSDRELIGQGIANIITGLCGGVAGSGATTATVVNIQAGGRTPLSGISRALVLLVIVIWAAPLTSGIPLAVLAGIVLKVGLTIINWGFLKRVHNISLKAVFIVYSVIILTVFVDLMVAVAVGVFVANILTITRLEEFQTQAVQAITVADDQVVLTPAEKEALDAAQGRVLLFHLTGPTMLFGVAKAINREHRALAQYDVLVMDLTEVPVLGVTSGLALENAIQEAVEAKREVIIVGATGNVRRRLETLGISEIISDGNWMSDRLLALQRGLAMTSGRSKTIAKRGQPATQASLNP